jgi:lactoylglutathione lyase
MIKYGYTILYVADVEKAVTFYSTAFGFSQKFITPEKDYAEMVTGTTVLAFASIALGESNIKNGFIQSSNINKPFGVELVMVCEDVSETVRIAISAGATIESDPVEKPWGQTVAYIRDINGFLVEVCTPVSM